MCIGIHENYIIGLFIRCEIARVVSFFYFVGRFNVNSKLGKQKLT